ncbi:MAG: cation transporter [Dehalococcoidia bacterium]
METTLKVKGMSCEHCVQRVTKALQGVSGIHNVKVDLGNAIVSFDKPEDVPLGNAIKAISEEGYEVQDS